MPCEAVQAVRLVVLIDELDLTGQENGPRRPLHLTGPEAQFGEVVEDRDGGEQVDVRASFTDSQTTEQFTMRGSDQPGMYPRTQQVPVHWESGSLAPTVLEGRDPRRADRKRPPSSRCGTGVSGGAETIFRNYQQELFAGESSSLCSTFRSYPRPAVVWIKQFAGPTFQNGMSSSILGRAKVKASPNRALRASRVPRPRPRGQP